MPTFVLEINISPYIFEDKLEPFVEEFVPKVAEILSKPKNFVLCTFRNNMKMLMGNDPAPCALASISSIGGINLENNTKLSEAFAAALQTHFGIPKERYFLTFHDTSAENCGWGGKTFAN